MIKLVKEKDYETWIALAKEVEPIFGPMVDSKDFQDGIRECIRNNNAYGIENGNGKLAGIIALDRKGSEILWLAVGKKYRGNKWGEKLVKKAIEELEENETIYVQTFANNIDEGVGARIIYEKNGFKYLKCTGQNPAGIETAMMVKNK